MSKGEKSKHLKSKLIIVQLSCLIFSLSAGFVSVYAWYTANRETSVTMTSISTETGLTINKFSYYTGNNVRNSYFYGYDPVNATQTGITYSSTYFTEITGTENNGETEYTIPQTLYVPNKRCTFALEVSSGFAYEQFVHLVLTQYASPASSTQFIAGTTTAIRLSQAICLYGKTYELTASTDAPDVAAFINSTSLFNRFTPTTQTDSTVSNFTDDTALTAGTISQSYPTPAATNGESHLLFLFTIEFSNASSTYYTETSSSNYWSLNSAGNSNAYEGLTFQFNKLALQVDRIGTSYTSLDEMKGTCASTRVINDGTGTLPSCTPPTNYTFAGWYDPYYGNTYTDTTGLFAPTSLPPDLYATYTAS